MKIKKYLLISAAIPIILAGCDKSTGYIREEGLVWNTEYHITFRGPETLRDSILSTLETAGKSLSLFNPASLVSRVNNGDSIKVDNHFIRVWECSRIVNRESGGAFDPTLSPLITAWGFGPGHKATSDTLRIDSLLSFTGIDKTAIRDSVIYKGDRRLNFNFSAVAKGYGCDMIGEMFKRNGVTDYLVEIGGEIAASGKSPRGGNWKISIDRPSDDASDLQHTGMEVIEISDCGVATSGNYRNYHEAHGERYGHTIDSKTGRPLHTDILSATVIAPTCMEADAYATACMAMGSQKAAEMAARLDMAAMFILADTTVWMNSRFRHLTSQDVESTSISKKQNQEQ